MTLRRVANVAALDQDGRAARPFEDGQILALPGVAISRFKAAEHSEVDVGG